MILPTPEQVATFKAEAVRRFGSDRAMGVLLGEPTGAMCVFAPLDFAGWCDLLDAQSEDVDTGNKRLFVDRLLWPSLDEALSLAKRWPAAVGQCARELIKLAGETSAQPVVRELKSHPLAGLSAEKAAELAAAHDRALWGVRINATSTFEAVSLVMQAPLSEMYLACRAADRDARGLKRGIELATSSFVLDAIVWSSEPVKPLLDRLPALSADLRLAFYMMGGAGVSVSTKSF